MNKLAGAAVAFVALTSCGYPKSGPAPGPLQPEATTTAAQRWPGTTAEQLEHGRSIFIAKCNGCHDYPDVHAIAEDRWPGVLKKMSVKADLTAEESTMVLHFILAARQ